MPVTFEPTGAVAWVERGSTVLEAARIAGVEIVASCGGRGVCGACGVKVEAGQLGEPGEAEQAALRLSAGAFRLACQAEVVAAVTVRPVIRHAQGLTPDIAARSDSPLVIAVDLGTTNVAVAAIDADSGRELGRVTVPNRQCAWGADVLSRVAAAVAGEASTLQSSAVDTVATALELLGVARERVTRVVVAGNTAMAGLFAGVDVTGLAGQPFTLPQTPHLLDSSVAASLGLHPEAEVLMVPAAAGFVGGDVTAGLLVAGFPERAGNILFVDVGTNAEVALSTGRSLHVASAAAGPAFDRTGLPVGAAGGKAVTAVSFEDGGLAPRVAGVDSPARLAGSGVVSLMAALLRTGHLDRDGRMRSEGPLSARFAVDDAGVLVLRPFEELPELTFSQLDVRDIQLAKAAVRVGVDFVLQAAALKPADVDRVWLAGAFAAALSPADLDEIGMLPQHLAEKIEVLGNGSLLGASAIALEPKRLGTAASMLDGVRHVDLAAEPGFAAALMNAVALDSGRG